MGVGSITNRVGVERRVTRYGDDRVVGVYWAVGLGRLMNILGVGDS